MEHKGKFIVFEGIDGSGKSSHIMPIKSFIEERFQVQVKLLREPGSTPLGDALRDLILAHEMSAHTEALLMFAARKEMVEQKLIPALNQGYWVLCDRFVGSSYAYQGAGRHLGMDAIELLHDWCDLGVLPDLTLYFDLNVETAQQRAQARGAKDRLDAESVEFFERVRMAYLRLASIDPTVSIIDSTPGIQEVQNAALLPILRAFPQQIERSMQVSP